MSAARLNLTLEEGSTFDPQFALWHVMGFIAGVRTYSDPVDLTGWGVRLQARRTLDETEKILDLDSENDALPDGTITLDEADGSDVPNRINVFVGATKMTALLPDDFKRTGGQYTCLWDLERYLIADPETVRRIFKGFMIFDREVTG